MRLLLVMHKGVCVTPYLKEQYKEHGVCAAVLRVYGADSGIVRLWLNGRTYILTCRHGVALGIEQPEPEKFVEIFNFCLSHPGQHGKL